MIETQNPVLGIEETRSYWSRHFAPMTLVDEVFYTRDLLTIYIFKDLVMSSVTRSP